MNVLLRSIHTLRHVVRNALSPLDHLDNLLAQLLPLTNLPKVQEDLNAFFIPSFAERPKVTSLAGDKNKTTKTKSGKVKKRKIEQSQDLEKLPDWMATYDSDSSSSDSLILEKGSRTRATQLSIHGSVHSVASHQNQYSSLWEVVLSVIRLDDSWTRRILVGLHGESGILGHMKPERRVRVADWLGGLVDRGGVHALLAMNGLFVLMTQFNLFVCTTSRRFRIHRS